MFTIIRIVFQLLLMLLALIGLVLLVILWDLRHNPFSLVVYLRWLEQLPF